MEWDRERTRNGNEAPPLSIKDDPAQRSATFSAGPGGVESGRAKVV